MGAMSECLSWLGSMGRHITGQTQDFPTPESIHALRFVRSWSAASPGALWIGESGEIRSLLESGQSLKDKAFCCAGGDEALVELAQSRQACLIATDLELFPLFDKISDALHRRQERAYQLLEAAGMRHNIQDVINTGARLAKGALFLLNADLQVLYNGGSACLDSPYAREMLELGCLSMRSLNALCPEGWAGRSPGAVLRRPVGGQQCCCVQRVFKGQRLVSYLLLFAPTSDEMLDAPGLLGLIQENINRAASAGDRSCWAGADFKSLLADLLSGRLCDEVEIGRRFSLLPCVPQRFCTFVVIEPAAPRGMPAAPAAMLAQLEDIFPQSSSAFYDNAVVMLLSSPDRTAQPTPVFDQERFQALLFQYDSFAAISNATSRRAMLRTNYILTKSVLHLGCTLRRSSKQRIFLFEDYAEYVMIDLCINSFSALMGHDDIIYLTHPAAVKLYRHDLRYGTNLMEALYYYCLNNLNISQSAKAAYMHRNTFSSRLAKALELVGPDADLSNGEIQQRMIFSYKILRYYDKYAKINLQKRLSLSDPGQMWE